jgi:hypothetical protein
MKKYTISLLTVLALILISCGEKGPKAPDAGELKTYTDEATKFSIDFPSNWDENKIVGKQFQSFSMNSGKIRFTNFSTEGDPVARISLTVMVLDSTQSLQTAIDTSLVFDKEYYSAPVDVTIDGTKGKKLTYSFPLSDGQFDGELIVASKDGVLAHIIKFEAFAGTMEKYRPTFDKILKSIKLGTNPEVGVITGEKEELPPPSTTFKTVSGKGYTIQIPDNFNAISKGGGVMYAGERRGDSYVMVNTSKTTSNNLKGTAERNAKAVGANKTTKIKIGGKEAYLVSYEATSQIHRDMYYVLSNDVLYQIVVDYYKEAADMYKGVLTKSANSIKFK